MPSALERIIAAYESRPMKSVECPEWGMTIYFRTPNQATLKKGYADSKGDPLEQAARLVMLMATDIDGNRLFSPSDMAELMNRVEAGPINRIAQAIMAEFEKVDLSPAGQAAAEKN